MFYFCARNLAVKTHNEVTPFYRHFEPSERSEQILIKFAILLQVRLTHAQTFFRGVYQGLPQLARHHEEDPGDEVVSAFADAISMTTGPYFSW